MTTSDTPSEPSAIDGAIYHLAKAELELVTVITAALARGDSAANLISHLHAVHTVRNEIAADAVERDRVARRRIEDAIGTHASFVKTAAGGAVEGPAPTPEQAKHLQRAQKYAEDLGDDPSGTQG